MRSSQFLVCLAVFSMVIADGTGASAGAKGGATPAAPGSSPSASSLPPGSYSPNSSPSANASGAGGNSSPIESVVLEFDSARRAAQELANDLFSGMKTIGLTSPTAVFVTGSDTAALLARTLLLRQIKFYGTEIGIEDARLKAPHASEQFCQSSKAALTSLPLDSALTTLQNGQTLLQAISSSFARNESATSSSGDIADNTLISLVAGYLRGKNVVVRIPSVFLAASDLPEAQGGSLEYDLDSLQAKLTELEQDAIGVEQSPSCKTQKDMAGAKKIASDITLLQNSVQSFYGLLVGGTQGTNSASVNAGSGSTPLQLALYAEEILASANTSDTNSNAFFIIMNALDSGGSTLTKNYFPASTELFYSGGLTLSYFMFNSRGELQCGGTAVAYRGFIREREIESSIPASRVDASTPSPNPTGADNISDLCAPSSTPTSKTASLNSATSSK